MLFVGVCFLVFLISYFVSMIYTSVFYHRAITHRAMRLKPWAEKFIVATGPWMTGLDPKVWCCLHRLHHLHTDTKEDPHSPVNVGLWGVLLAQKKSYSDVTHQLIRKEAVATATVVDLDFDLNWLSTSGYFLLPYAVHTVVALLLAWCLGGFAVAVCYFVGMMGHPIQGFFVNSFGHYHGYRNFDRDDNSKNNTVVSWLVFGEGYQNNHHEFPGSPKFSVKWYEFDLGYLFCGLSRLLRMTEKNLPPT